MRKVLILFGVLEDSDVEWLASIGGVRDLKAGAHVILENEENDAVFVLLTGSCSVRATAVEGHEIARLLPGEVLGEMSFIDSRPPSASVITLERSQLFSIPKDVLSERLSREDGFAARFYRALAICLGTRLRATVSKLGYVDKAAKPSSSPEPDDTDPDVLERSAAAGRRFNDLQRRALAGASAKL